jgi:hypothetical protein
MAGRIRQCNGIWYVDAYASGHRFRRAISPHRAHAEHGLRELLRADRLGFDSVALDKILLRYLEAFDADGVEGPGAGLPRPRETAPRPQF